MSIHSHSSLFPMLFLLVENRNEQKMDKAEDLQRIEELNQQVEKLKISLLKKTREEEENMKVSFVYCRDKQDVSR